MPSRSGRGKRHAGLGRRAFVGRSLAGLAGTLDLLRGNRILAQGAPSLITPDRARPAIPCGTAVGDVTADRALVWSRTDRPARLFVEYSTTESFRDPRRIAGPAALPESDFTARVDLTGLPAGQDVFYRVLFQDLAELGTWSVPVPGRFRTAPASRRDVSFAWSADTCGQGWGIDLARGGLRMYETLRRGAPDFFVHCGDNIYADNPLLPEVKLDDGSLWRNVVTEAKSKVAETLDEFRGAYLYNLLDENLRRFNAEVPGVPLWDDHEVLNNWYPTETLEADPRYRVKSVALLAARAKRALFEYIPFRPDGLDAERVYRSVPYGPLLEVFVLDMRTYRGPNSGNRQPSASTETAMLGARQVAWLKDALARSKATWKAIAIDQPLGLVVPDAGHAFEAVANGDGPPLGRELEIADLLRFIRDQKVRNVVWLTADVHYAAAHHYDPQRAQFKEFRPFWEFVAGPLHAGTFGPEKLDDTFGPEVRFLGIPQGMKPNRPPSDGLQFFGTVRIDGRREVMTVRLQDVEGKVLYSGDLEPERG